MSEELKRLCDQLLEAYTKVYKDFAELAERICAGLPDGEARLDELMNAHHALLKVEIETFIARRSDPAIDAYIDDWYRKNAQVPQASDRFVN